MVARGGRQTERQARDGVANAPGTGGPSEAGTDRMTRFFAVKSRGGRESAERSRILKKVLPWVTGVVLVAVLAWPFINQRSDSITLSYKDLISQGEQVRIIGAHYTGTDTKNRPFEVNAAEGMQERTDSDHASLTRVEARLQVSATDSVAVTGGTGAYDRARDHLGLAGGITLNSTSGYKLETEKADVDLAAGVAKGTTDVSGAAPFGSFSAKGFTLGLEDRHLTLEGGVRVKLDPGKRKTDPVRPEPDKAGVPAKAAVPAAKAKN